MVRLETTFTRLMTSLCLLLKSWQWDLNPRCSFDSRLQIWRTRPLCDTSISIYYFSKRHTKRALQSQSPFHINRRVVVPLSLKCLFYCEIKLPNQSKYIKVLRPQLRSHKTFDLISLYSRFLHIHYLFYFRFLTDTRM